MTASGRPGPPTAVESGGTTLVCARDRDDRLLYVVQDFFGRRGDTLFADLAGDPTAVVTTTGAIHVLARCRGGRLRHWEWDFTIGEEPEVGDLVEQPDHGWFAAYDPVAVADSDGGFHVHARGADDVLMRWRVGPAGSPHGVESLGGEVAARPANLKRVGRVPDIFVVGRDGTLAHHGFRGKLNNTTDVVGWKKLGGQAIGGPVAVNWGGLRLDVLVPGTDEELLHWGFAPNEGSHTELVPGEDPDDAEADRIWITGTWFGPDVGDLGTASRLDSAIAVEPDIARVFGRDEQGRIVRWHWDGGFFVGAVGWIGPEQVGQVRSSPPAALLSGPEAMAIAWTGEGTTLTGFGLENGAWVSSEVSIQWAEGADQPAMRDIDVEVRALLSRSTDLLRLGLAWEGFDVAPGSPPRLVPSAGALTHALRLVFPPQSTGEETLGRDPVADPAPGAGTRAFRSGPSQLVIDVPAEPVPLTLAGVLAATHQGTVRGGDVVGLETSTFLELPWQLFVSPDGAVVHHGSEPEPTGDGTSSLWRTRLTSDDGALRIREFGTEDPFTVPLTAANRASIAAQDGPARFERLELTSLGGDLSAVGSWDNLTWEHETRLGRDQRVRVTTRGVLYPYGHRAELTEITERHVATPGEDVASLRKQTFLTVTQPTRDRSGDGTLSRAFPFSSVTITKRRFDDVAVDWTGGTGTRKRKVPADLQVFLNLARGALDSMPRSVDDWVGPVPHPEAVAGFAGNPDIDGSVQQRQGRLALDRILAIEAIQGLEEQIAAASEVGDQPINLFFTPRTAGGRWVEFPVTCTTGGETVSFVTPMIFVVEDQYDETPTMLAYDTLTANDVQRRIQDTWATIRSGAAAVADELRRDQEYAGVVDLGGGPLDVIGTGAPEDQQLVHRIYVSGRLDGRTFHPALGPGDDVSTDVSQPAWALDVTLPSLQELLPGATASHRVVTAFTDGFLSNGAAEDVIHNVVGPAVGAARDAAGQLVDEAGTALSSLKGVAVDFTKNADRSGGLVSPKVVADALSRDAGPVNLAGLTSLDPSTLFDQGATLLGFSLASLLESILPDGLPTITTDTSGPQPVVTMAWPAQEPGLPPEDQPAQVLDPTPPFGPFDPDNPDDPPPTLSLVVRTAGTDVRTEATLRHFSLSFPTSTPLLRLVFKQLRYVQEAGRAPDLQVDGLDAKFSDELDLLTALQEKIGLGDKGPMIKVDGSGIVASYAFAIPDAQSGAFVMRNLAFSIGVTVPFQGDPVSLDLAFASRATPFSLSVMMFGGGGYVELGLNHKGLSKLDVALEFGASIGVDFVIASGEAHVLGGVRFELVGPEEVKLTGYLRIGGSLEVLGLVTVSVELVLSLGYESTGNRLVGRATLVIEIDLTLYSDSIELDSGEWEIAGGAERANDPTNQPPPRFGASADEDPFLALVREQRAAFAPVEGDEP